MTGKMLEKESKSNKLFLVIVMALFGAGVLLISNESTIVGALFIVFSIVLLAISGLVKGNCRSSCDTDDWDEDDEDEDDTEEEVDEDDTEEVVEEEVVEETKPDSQPKKVTAKKKK